MSITIKNKYLAIAIVVAIVALLFTGYIIGHKKATNALKPTIQAQEEIIRISQVRISDQLIYVSKMEQENTTLKDAIKNLEITKEELRKLDVKRLNEITRLQMKVDTLLKSVNNNGQIIFTDTCISEHKPAILLPFEFNKTDKWLNLKGTVNTSGVLDLKLTMPMNVDIYTSYLAKEKKYEVTVTTANPYMQVNNIKSQKFDVVKPKVWGIGLQAGYGLILSNPVKLSPYLGVGVQRSVIRF